jgi:hypothetical protein
MLIAPIAPPAASSSLKIYSAAGTTLNLLSSDGSEASFVASALTAPRTLTIPDLDGVIATLAGLESFTNKTITGATNTVEASALRTTGSAVVVSGAAPPTTGHVLTATSATTAAWVMGGGGSGIVAYSMLPFVAVVNSTTWTSVSYFTWSNARYSGYTAGALIYSIVIGGPAANIRLRDITNNVVLANDNAVAVSGVRVLAVTNPASNAIIALEVQKTNENIPDPTITGATLEFMS